MNAAAASGTSSDLDPKELKRLTLRVVDDFSGSVATQLIYAGDRLGLFKVLGDAGVGGRAGLTAEELASRSGCNLRYLETWCEACVAHSFVETQGSAADATAGDGARRYWLTPAQRELFANEGGQFFQCGTSQLLSATARAMPAMLDRGFRNPGRGGVSYQEFGADAMEGMARMSQPVHRDLLPGWVRSLPEAQEALDASSRPSILDVGCGCGGSTVALASAFETASVLGIDPDGSSVQRARELVEDRGLDNASFRQCGIEDLTPDDAMAPPSQQQQQQQPPGSLGFDLVLAYDCVHDMVDPLAALAGMRALLSPSGVLLWFEPHGSDDPYENRTILGARMVAGLALNCVTTSMASGGAGLGAHGCTPARARQLAERAGFTVFRQEHGLKGAAYRNNVYILR